jgi:hypothetical protein
MIALAVIPIWLILHVPGGDEVSINIKSINAMREGEGGDKNKLLTGGSALCDRYGQWQVGQCDRDVRGGPARD